MQYASSLLGKSTVTTAHHNCFTFYRRKADVHLPFAHPVVKLWLRLQLQLQLQLRPRLRSIFLLGCLVTSNGCAELSGLSDLYDESQCQGQGDLSQRRTLDVRLFRVRILGWTELRVISAEEVDTLVMLAPLLDEVTTIRVTEGVAAGAKELQWFSDTNDNRIYDEDDRAFSSTLCDDGSLQITDSIAYPTTTDLIPPPAKGLQITVEQSAFEAPVEFRIVEVMNQQTLVPKLVFRPYGKISQGIFEAPYGLAESHSYVLQIYEDSNADGVFDQQELRPETFVLSEETAGYGVTVAGIQSQ